MNKRDGSATTYDEELRSRLVLRASVVEPSETVDRLMYASEASFYGSPFVEMNRIRHAALRNNAPLGVCTALLYKAGWFLQWKEGPVDAITELMKRVSKDPRHRHLRSVHSSRGPRVLPGLWSMVVDLSREEPGELAERVRCVSEDMMLARHYSPTSVWAHLSLPAKHISAAQQLRRSNLHLVLVCSAAGALSFELVQWLAQQHSHEVAHRRFSGEHDLDVAADYVDVVEGNRPMRVVAMARKGLGVPLVRALLSDYSHVLLLLSGDEERDTSLGLKVTTACRRLADPPCVMGIAQFAAWHAPVLAIARTEGLEYIACEEQSLKPKALWRAALRACVDVRLP
jgi:hypothetical protein